VHAGVIFVDACLHNVTKIYLWKPESPISFPHSPQVFPQQQKEKPLAKPGFYKGESVFFTGSSQAVTKPKQFP
jgi:hypothetical protein